MRDSAGVDVTEKILLESRDRQTDRQADRQAGQVVVRFRVQSCYVIPIRVVRAAESKSKREKSKWMCVDVRGSLWKYV